MSSGFWPDSFLIAASVIIPAIGVGLIVCLVDLVRDLRRERTPEKPAREAGPRSS